MLRSLISLVSISLFAVACGGEMADDQSQLADDDAAILGPPGPTPYDPCIFLPSLPDLVPYTFAKSLAAGNKTQLTVTIRNRGCAESGYMAYAIKVTLDNQPVQHYGATWAPTSSAGTPAGNIPRGGTQTFTMILDYSPATVASWGGDWRVETDAVINQVTESNENNNVVFYAN